MQEPYIVVIGHNLLVLQSRASMYAQDQGYEPTGGPFWDEQDGEWCQAMYRAPEPQINTLAAPAASNNHKTPTWIQVTAPTGTIDLRADEWIAEDGHLRVYRSGVEVAEFPPGQWKWVMVDDPDQCDIGRKGA